MNGHLFFFFLQDFHIDALQKFIEEGTIPLVTFFTDDPNNHKFVSKFFDNVENAKVIQNSD